MPVCRQGHFPTWEPAISSPKALMTSDLVNSCPTLAGLSCCVEKWKKPPIPSSGSQGCQLLSSLRRFSRFGEIGARFHVVVVIIVLILAQLWLMEIAAKAQKFCYFTLPSSHTESLTPTTTKQWWSDNRGIQQNHYWRRVDGAIQYFLGLGNLECDV